MPLRSLVTRVLVTSGLCVAPALACAGPVGVLQAVSGSATLTASGVQFLSSPTPVSTGIFAGLDNTSINLSDVAFAAGGQLVTFQARPNLTVSATFRPGSFSAAMCGAPAAVGQVCTPVAPPPFETPLSLYNTANGSVASFALDLTVQDGANTHAGSGVVTMQFAQSYQEVLNTLFSGGHLDSSYSAQFDAGTAGTFHFGGGISLSRFAVDFTPVTTVGGLAGGQFMVGPFSSGAFGSLMGTTGISSDLGFGSISDFLRFAGNPNLAFDLGSVDSGAFGGANCGAPAAVGQVCTPVLPPPFVLGNFEFANLFSGPAISSVLSFNVDGSMSDLAGDTTYQGIYSMQFLGLSYQQVLAATLGGGSLTTTYSATLFTDQEATVPEPLSIVLVFTGGAAALLHRQRRLTRPRGRAWLPFA